MLMPRSGVARFCVLAARTRSPRGGAAYTQVSEAPGLGMHRSLLQIMSTTSLVFWVSIGWLGLALLDPLAQLCRFSVYTLLPSIPAFGCLFFALDELHRRGVRLPALGAYLLGVCLLSALHFWRILGMWRPPMQVAITAVATVLILVPTVAAIRDSGRACHRTDR